MYFVQIYYNICIALLFCANAVTHRRRTMVMHADFVLNQCFLELSMVMHVTDERCDLGGRLIILCRQTYIRNLETYFHLFAYTVSPIINNYDNQSVEISHKFHFIVIIISHEQLSPLRHTLIAHTSASRKLKQPVYLFIILYFFFVQSLNNV
jgi:hypothetical protein